MAQFNRVYVNTASVGLGTVTLGAVKSPAFCTFAEAGAVNGDTIRSYIIEEGSDFEIGYGVYNSALPSLTRAVVRLSKIGGAVGTSKMTLAGNATVRCIAAKEDLVLQDESGNVTISGLLTASGGIAFTPAAGSITSTTVAGAINELDSRKAALANLASVALTGAAVDLAVAAISWTPTLAFATPGDLAVTYSTQVGTYRYLAANVVLVQFDIVTSAFTFTTASGALQITGLGLTAVIMTGQAVRGSLQFGGINKAGYTQLNVGMGSGNNILAVNASGMGVAPSALVAADMPSGGTITLRGSLVICI